MQTDPSPDAAPSARLPATPSPAYAPDHRHMYLLLAGIVVGLALSPWIMGKLLGPVAYDRWYFGGGPALDEYQAFLQSDDQEAKAKELLDRLNATGVTQDAIIEMRASMLEQARQARKPYVDAIVAERRDHEERYRGVMTAMILPVIVLMFLEPLFEAVGPLAGVRRRLVLGRYAVLAAWITLALAKPHMMSGTAWLLAILAMVLAIAVVGAPMLLGKGKGNEEEERDDAEEDMGS